MSSVMGVTVSVKTANGRITLYPVFCEVTGKQLCWKTMPPNDDDSPAYISFSVVSDVGIVLMLNAVRELKTC